MTLSFTTKWTKSMGALAGQPNYFVEKIWAGIPDNEEAFDSTGVYADENITRHKGRYYSKYMHLHKRQFGAFWDGHSYHGQTGIKSFIPKLHTIRHDPHDRWKAGNKIHFVINNRTKDRFQFAPVIEVKNLQEIEIKWSDILENTSGRTAMNDRFVSVTIHDRGCAIRRYLNLEQLQILSINDGFNSVEDFFKFFNKDFTGKIIHWTDLKY